MDSLVSDQQKKLKRLRLAEYLTIVGVVFVVFFVLLLHYQGQQKVVRDQQRQADLDVVASVLYDIKSDEGGYPVQAGEGADIFNSGVATHDKFDNLMEMERVKEVIQERPVDPKNSGKYRYRYGSTVAEESGDYNARLFILEAELETEEAYKVISGDLTNQSL